VWVRGRTATEECPKSFITAESLGHLDNFHAWKLGGGPVAEMPAKQVDAFVVLEHQWREETRNVR